MVFDRTLLELLLNLSVIFVWFGFKILSSFMLVFWHLWDHVGFTCSHFNMLSIVLDNLLKPRILDYS